jgi:hypothetical protein
LEVRVETGLVERARNGDVDAFDALIAHRVEAMLRTAIAIIGDPGCRLLGDHLRRPCTDVDDRRGDGRVTVGRCRRRGVVPSR